MKRFLFFTVAMIYAVVGFLEAQEERPNKKVHRIAFYIDEFNQERYNGSDAICRQFAINLHQEAGAIVVSGNVLKSYLLRKFDHLLISQAADRHPENVDKIYKLLEFKIDTWNIYHVTGTNCFVFLPKDKSKNKSYDFTIPVSTPEEKSVTFSLLKIDSWKKYNSNLFVDDDAKIVGLNNFCVEPWRSVHPNIVSDLQKIFLTDADIRKNEFIMNTFVVNYNPKEKNNPKKKEESFNLLHDFADPWVVYWSGHGNESSGSIGLYNRQVSKVFNFLNLLNVFLALFRSCCAGGKLINLYKFVSDLNKYQSQIDTFRYYLIVASITDGSVASKLHIVDEKVSIGPDNDIDRFFSYAELGCVEGRNKETQWLSGVMSSMSLADDWFYQVEGINSIPQIQIPRVGWYETFDFNPAITSLNRVKLRSYQLVNRPLEIKNKLSVVVHPTVVIPTLKLLAVEHEKRPDWIGAWNSFPIKASYPSVPTTVALYPTFISKKPGNAIHVIREIMVEPFETEEGMSVPIGILQFFRDAFCNLQGRQSKKAFFIKSLKGINDFSSTLEWIRKADPAAGLEKALEHVKDQPIELKDVFVETWTKIDYSLHTNYKDSLTDKNQWFVKIAFEYEGTYWKYNYADYVSKEVGGKLVSNELADGTWDFIQCSKEEYEQFVGLKQPVRGPGATKAEEEYVRFFEAVNKAFKEYEEELQDYHEPKKKFTQPNPDAYSHSRDSGILSNSLVKLKNYLSQLKNKLYHLSTKLGKLSTMLVRSKA